MAPRLCLDLAVYLYHLSPSLRAAPASSLSRSLFLGFAHSGVRVLHCWVLCSAPLVISSMHCTILQGWDTLTRGLCLSICLKAWLDPIGLLRVSLDPGLSEVYLSGPCLPYTSCEQGLIHSGPCPRTTPASPGPPEFLPQHHMGPSKNRRGDQVLGGATQNKWFVTLTFLDLSGLKIFPWCTGELNTECAGR